MERRTLVVERTSCRSCGGPLETVFDLGEQLVRWDKPEKAPLVLCKCSKCGLVQLRHTVSRDYLFRGDYPYRSGATQTMREHLKGIVKDAVARVHLRPEDFVIDIGSNDGTLLSFYPQMVYAVGFEPAHGVADTSFVPAHGSIIHDFFTADKFRRAWGDWQPEVRIITAIAMLYDLDDPNKFLQDVKRVLAPDGLFCLQVNYLPDTLRNNAVGDFVHEHLCYYSLTTLLPLLDKNDLEADDVSFNQINGGSVRLFISHKHTTATPFGYSTNRSVGQAILAETKLDSDFQAFSKRILAVAIKVKSFLLEARDKGEPVDVIGASTRGSTFLQYIGVDTSVVRFVIERDRSKVGKSYLGLPIVSEETAFKNPPRYKIAMPYWFKAEILEREKPFLDGGGALIFPLPEPTIVDKNGERPL